MQSTLEIPESAGESPSSGAAGSPAWAWWVVAGLLGMHAIFAWLVRPAGVLTGQDDAVYIMLARGLRDFGYSDLFAVGLPRHGLYPPGYPLLLSFWGLLAGDSFDGYVALSVLCSVGGLAFSWLVLRSLLPLRVALVALAALAFNPYLVEYASSVASEAPFLLFSMLAVWLAARGRTTTRSALGLAAIAIFAALTRAVGATLVLALGVWWLSRRRWRPAVSLALLSVALIGPWLLWITTAPGQFAGHSYVADALVATEDAPGPVAVIADRVSRNAPRYFVRSLPYSLSVPTIPGTPIDNALMASLLTISLGAGIWLLWRAGRLEAVYVAGYLGLLLVWPWAVPRFLYPLLPLVVAAMLVGLARAGGRLHASAGRLAPMLLALLFATAGLWQTLGMVRAAAACERGGELPAASCLSPDQASFFAAIDYIDRELPSDARLLSAKGEPLWHYTGRQIITPPRALRAGPDGLLRVLREENVEYVLLGSLQAWEPNALLRALEGSCSGLDLVAGFPPRTLLLRVRPIAASGQPTEACAALAEYRRLNQGRDFSEDA